MKILEMIKNVDVEILNATEYNRPCDAWDENEDFKENAYIVNVGEKSFLLFKQYDCNEGDSNVLFEEFNEYDKKYTKGESFESAFKFKGIFTIIEDYCSNGNKKYRITAIADEEKKLRFVLVEMLTTYSYGETDYFRMYEKEDIDGCCLKRSVCTNYDMIAFNIINNISFKEYDFIEIQKQIDEGNLSPSEKTYYTSQFKHLKQYTNEELNTISTIEELIKGLKNAIQRNNKKNIPEKNTILINNNEHDVVYKEISMSPGTKLEVIEANTDDVWIKIYGTGVSFKISYEVSTLFDKE